MRHLKVTAIIIMAVGLMLGSSFQFSHAEDVEVTQVPLVVTVDADTYGEHNWFDIEIRFAAGEGSESPSPAARVENGDDSYDLDYDSPGVLKCQIRQGDRIIISDLKVGQEYSVTVPGRKGKRVISEYMCVGGRVKSNVTQDESENTVSCTIRSGSDEDKELVTDPSMINRVKVHYRTLETGTGEVPYRFNAKFGKGYIAHSCGISNYHTEYIETTAYVRENPDFDITPISALLEFRPGPGDSGDTRVFEYGGIDVTYEDGGSIDIFHADGRMDLGPLLERPLGDTDEQRTVVVGSQNAPSQYEIRINVPADPSREPTYEIWRIADSKGNEITPVKVDRIDIDYERGGTLGGIEILNGTPSSVRESFEYVLTLHLPEAQKNEWFEVARRNTNGDTTPMPQVEGETPYRFTLNSKESIMVLNLPSGTTYDIKELNDNDYRTTVMKDDYGDLNAVTPKRVSDGSEIRNIPVYRNAEYVYHGGSFPEYNGMPPKCPPVPPPGPGLINTTMSWRNTPDEGFKVIVQKQPETEPTPDMTLEGAEFIMHSPGIPDTLTAVTDENGVATFAGVDRNQKYILAETRAPGGYGPAHTIWVLSNEEMNEAELRYFVLSYRYVLGIEMTGQEIKWIKLDPDSDDPITINAVEPLVTTTLDLRKYLLKDESKYDGPMFEFLTFRLPEQNSAYRDSLWPRSYFEDIEGVEFKLTLDSDPDNPRFSYTAVTGEDGRTRFKRDLGVQNGETDEDLYRIQYGKYTLKETKAPDGFRKMEDQQITITPQRYTAYGDDDPDPYQADVIRVVNPPAKGDLKISKKVSGKSADTNKDFTFTITLKDPKGNELEEEFSYEGSKEGKISSGGTIELKHGEAVTIKDLPEGTTYEVKETGADGYTASVNDKKGSTASGTIKDKTTAQVDYVNSADDEPEDPNEPDEPGEPEDPDSPEGPDGPGGDSSVDDTGKPGADSFVKDEEDAAKRDGQDERKSSKGNGTQTGDDSAPVSALVICALALAFLVAGILRRRIMKQ